MKIFTINQGVVFLMILTCSQAIAQVNPAFEGQWQFNTELSDNTDKEVGRALRAMGQKISRCWLNCEKDRFRGGPEEQELYDRLSYDKSLTITLQEPEYLFVYDDNYRRPVFTDGRTQSISLAGLDEVEDFSMAHWEGSTLLVEARPRDGGFANEAYTLSNQDSQLQVKLYIQPKGFTESIELTRVYDRLGTVQQ